MVRNGKIGQLRRMECGELPERFRFDDTAAEPVKGPVEEPPNWLFGQFLFNLAGGKNHLKGV